MKKAVKPLGLSVPVYQTNDPLFYRNQSIANPPPTSALLAFSSNEPDHIGSVILPAKDEDLTRFVRRNRYPSFFDLSGDNYKSIFQAEDTPLVVLGAIQDAEGTERREMIKMANAWKKGGRPFEQRVLFVAASAGHWDKWLRKMVSITPIDIPGLVVIDTATREYYDTTIEGERALFKGADAFSILEGIFQKFLTPKKIESGLEWGSRSGALMLFEAGVSLFLSLKSTFANETSNGAPNTQSWQLWVSSAPSSRSCTRSRAACRAGQAIAVDT